MTHSKLSSQRPASASYRSNILGATGLSRAALAEVFRNIGLFGSDSSLAASERAVLQSRLPLIEGLPAPAILPKRSTRLDALSDLVDALIEGDDLAISTKAAVAREAGFNERAISEIGGVIDNVRLVFGLPLSVHTAAIQPTLSALHRAA